MNRLFLTAILFLGISVAAIGQERTKTALAKGSSEMTQGKTSGNYSFTLPKGTSAETVQKSANYYTHYFTVNYNEATQEAKITMVTNDEKSRHVICRFLIASGVEKMNIDGKDLPLEEFFTTYMK